jgi:hypothetical protein
MIVGQIENVKRMWRYEDVHAVAVAVATSQHDMIPGRIRQACTVLYKIKKIQWNT